MPEPLTPPTCDLRDFPTMPLDAGRLFGSEFHAVSSDAAWRAGVTLWLKSWHQVPAASLPDDDVQLARLAEFARDVKGWKKVREQALRGWIKCDDGRLYHPVVAEKALAAWERKESYRQRSKKGNAARWGGQKDGDEQSHKDNQEPSRNDALGMPKGLLERPKGEGEGEGYIPLSNDNGASALPNETERASDTAFWDTAKAYLRPHTKDPGKLIGKWVRDHGKVETARGISAAQIERAIEPIAYVEGYFRKHKSNGEGPYRGGLSVPC